MRRGTLNWMRQGQTASRGDVVTGAGGSRNLNQLECEDLGWMSSLQLFFFHVNFFGCSLC